MVAHIKTKTQQMYKYVSTLKFAHTFERQWQQAGL